MKRSLLLSAFAACAVAQDYRGDDGWRQDYGQENMYTDWAAKREGGAVGRGGWITPVLAGVGGYVLGAKIHTARLKKSVPALRFKRKQRVECNVGGVQWKKGTVVKLWPKEAGQWMPYEILLDSGQKVIAPMDDDMIIRALSKKK